MFSFVCLFVFLFVFVVVVVVVFFQIRLWGILTVVSISCKTNITWNEVFVRGK